MSTLEALLQLTQLFKEPLWAEYYAKLFLERYGLLTA